MNTRVGTIDWTIIALYLVAYDLFKRHKPEMKDHTLVIIGKRTTVVGTLLAIVASPSFGHYTTIFEGIKKLISYVAPPITTVFLPGVFWKRRTCPITASCPP